MLHENDRFFCVHCIVDDEGRDNAMHHLEPGIRQVIAWISENSRINSELLVDGFQSSQNRIAMSLSGSPRA